MNEYEQSSQLERMQKNKKKLVEILAFYLSYRVFFHIKPSK